MKLFVLSLLTLLILVSCEKKVTRAPQTGEDGGEIIVGLLNEPENLSPMYPSFTAHNEITDMLFLPLHKQNVDGQIVPMLANSWEYSEDLKKITYYIKNDVMWQDGTPVTAYDVEWTFNQMKDEKNNYPLLSRLQYIDSVKAVSDNKIVFFFSRVYPMALFDSNIKPLPKHLLEKETNIQYSDYHISPSANGPYKLEKWEPGKYISLVKNENYSLPEKPFLNKIIYMIYNNQDDLINDLKLGKLDLAYDVSSEKKNDLGKLNNVSILEKKGNAYTYIGFNTVKEPFVKAEVRMGISEMINRDELIKSLLKGNGIPSNGPITPAFWAYSEEVKPIVYNMKEGTAKISGVLKNSNKGYTLDGKPFTVNIITDRNDPMLVNTANEVAKQLTDAGLSVKVKDLPSDSLIMKLFNRDYDMFVLSWQVDENFNPFPFWSSKKEIGKFNFVNYYNPKIDSLLNMAMSTMDKTEAYKYWEEFQQTISADEPYAFLFIPNRVIALNNNLKSFENAVSSNLDVLSNLDIFYVEKNSQKSVNLAQLFKKEEKKQETPVVKQETKKNGNSNKVETVKKEDEPKVEVKKTTASQLLSQEAAKTSTEKTTNDAKINSDTAKVVENKPIVTVQPAPVKIIQPPYPDAAKKVGVEGMVFVQVVVGADGKVKSAKVIKALNSACDQAALEAAYKAEFKAGTVDGVPTEMQATIPYRFK